MIHKKKCKGINKAKGFKGCGELRFIQYAGLCKDCLYEWLYHTGEGKELMDKRVIPNAKKEVKKKDRDKTKLLREKIETKTDVEKKLQKEINHIVRLIDNGHPCISSGRSLGKNYDAGHLYSTGANPTIRFHLLNIFAQSVHDNQHKGGNELAYFLRLEEVFSKELQDRVLSLKQIDALHLSKEELRDKLSVARGIVKWLKLQDRYFDHWERITLRDRFNEELGIYNN